MKQTTNIIEPLSSGQQQDVINKTQAYINQAAALFDIKNKAVEITFDLKGRSAGMYRVKNGKGRILNDSKERSATTPIYFPNTLMTVLTQPFHMKSRIMLPTSSMD